jgi:tetratricopeptide (TPR) repeat protein
MGNAGELTAAERELYVRGRMGFERGEDEQALAFFQRLLRTRRSYADVHYMVGLLHERRGDLAASAQSLEEALRINPGYAEAALALVSVYEQRGDYQRSQDLAVGVASGAPRRQAPIESALDPTTRGKLANLQAALGDAYREAGELRDAVEAYRKALDRCPDFHDIRHRLGVALREAGLPNQAIQEFRRVLRAHPRYLASKVQLGVTCYGIGRMDDALREWSEVLVQDPMRADARLYLRLVRAESGSPT